MIEQFWESEPCRECARLDAELERLRARVAELEEEVLRLQHNTICDLKQRNAAIDDADTLRGQNQALREALAVYATLGSWASRFDAVGGEGILFKWEGPGDSMAPHLIAKDTLAQHPPGGEKPLDAPAENE